MSLLVAIHDVAPVHLTAVQRLRDLAAACGVARVTLLVVPDFHRKGHVLASPETARWLRSRVDAGDEACLHGFHHFERRPAPISSDRWRARAATQGEGECLGLISAERNEMLRDGRREIEDVVGRPVRGFVAPAWLEPAGFSDVLAREGFAWHESSMWVERLLSPRERLHRPVIGFATRTPWRKAAALAWGAGLGAWSFVVARKKTSLVRLALHPADLQSAAVIALACRLMRQLAKLHASTTYFQALRLE